MTAVAANQWRGEAWHRQHQRASASERNKRHRRSNQALGMAAAAMEEMCVIIINIMA